MVYSGLVRSLVHDLKFGGKRELAIPLGDATAIAAINLTLDQRKPVVVPVPLHEERLRDRGFDQALLLAERVAAGLRAPIWPDALQRQQATAPQSGLNRRERQRNVRKAFSVPVPGLVRGRYLLLVDDVLTTGATVSAAAESLLLAGASAVGFVTASVAVSGSDVGLP